MTPFPGPLVLASRQSALALTQSRFIADRLRALVPGLEVTIRTYTTRGDADTTRPLPEIGGKGLFTAELDAALRRGEAHFAVHSLKDLPCEEDPELPVVAIPARASAHDLLVVREPWLSLDPPPDVRPDGSPVVVGTGSPRRVAQLKNRFGDRVRVAPLRGNVDTRLRKLAQGDYDAIVLAAAGVERLGLAVEHVFPLSAPAFLPAPAQGALAVQACRSPAGGGGGFSPEKVLATLALLDHAPTRFAVTAERAFLAALGGGCSVPVGAFCGAHEVTGVEQGRPLWGGVFSPDGGQAVTLSVHAAADDDPTALGIELARRVRALGGAEILAGER